MFCSDFGQTLITESWKDWKIRLIILDFLNLHFSRIKLLGNSGRIVFLGVSMTFSFILESSEESEIIMFLESMEISVNPESITRIEDSGIG